MTKKRKEKKCNTFSLHFGATNVYFCGQTALLRAGGTADGRDSVKMDVKK